MIAGIQSLSDPSPFSEECFAAALDNSPCVCMLGVQKSQVCPSLDPEGLAKQWGIGLDVAKKTVKATMQRGL